MCGASPLLPRLCLCLQAQLRFRNFLGQKPESASQPLIKPPHFGSLWQGNYRRTSATKPTSHTNTGRATMAPCAPLFLSLARQAQAGARACHLRDHLLPTHLVPRCSCRSRASPRRGRPCGTTTSAISSSQPAPPSSRTSSWPSSRTPTSSTPSSVMPFPSSKVRICVVCLSFGFPLPFLRLSFAVFRSLWSPSSVGFLLGFSPSSTLLSGDALCVGGVCLSVCASAWAFVPVWPAVCLLTYVPSLSAGCHVRGAQPRRTGRSSSTTRPASSTRTTGRSTLRAWRVAHPSFFREMWGRTRMSSHAHGIADGACVAAGTHFGVLSATSASEETFLEKARGSTSVV